MRVCVSGAGIAGPCLTWFLAKAGIHVTVIEKSRALFPHGQNVDIQGSARRVIDKMGLTEEVLKFNTTEKGTQFIDPQGRPFAPFPVKKGASASFTSEFEILRGDLAAIFYNASKNHPNVKYVFDTTITSILSNSEDSVQVQLSSGATEAYDLLVASDGQWSKIRKQCFSPANVSILDKGMYVAYFTVPRAPTDTDWWDVYQAGNSRIITLRPDPHGTTRAMFTCMPLTPSQTQSWQDVSRAGREAQQSLLRSEFASAGWQAQRLLNEMETAPDFYFQVIQQVKMSKWSNGRVICLGDTAYCPSPLTGMGTSLAISGAYVLAGELSELSEGEHPRRALDSYEKVFRPTVEESQSIPFVFPGAMHPAGPWKVWLFNNVIWLVSKIVAAPVLKNLFTEGNDDGFKLPEYDAFEKRDVKA